MGSWTGLCEADLLCRDPNLIGLLLRLLLDESHHLVYLPLHLHQEQLLGAVEGRSSIEVQSQSYSYHSDLYQESQRKVDTSNFHDLILRGEQVAD